MHVVGFIVRINILYVFNVEKLKIIICPHAFCVPSHPVLFQIPLLRVITNYKDPLCEIF